MTDDGGLAVEEHGGWWRLGGPGAGEFVLVNEFLAYLADRNYSPRTAVRMRSTCCTSPGG